MTTTATRVRITHYCRPLGVGKATSVISGTFFVFLAILVIISVGQAVDAQEENERRQNRQNGNVHQEPAELSKEDPCQVVADVIADLDFLSWTYSALQTAGLLTSFRSRNPGVTFLAPTNQGFAKAAQQLGFGSIRHLLEDRAITRRIIEQHLVPFVITANDLSPGQALRTMDFGSPLVVQSGRDKNTLEFAGSGGIASQVRVTLDYNICKAAVILVDNALIPADIFSIMHYDTEHSSVGGSEMRSQDRIASRRNTDESDNGITRNNPTAAVPTVSNMGNSFNKETSDDSNKDTTADAQPLPTRSFETNSISLDYPDYDFDDFIVDWPADGPRQVPTVGVRVPPISQQPPPQQQQQP